MRDVGREHALQLAARQRIAREEIGHEGDAEPGDGGAEHGLHVVAQHRAGQPLGQARQGPVLDARAGDELVAQAGMVGELGRLLRHAMAREVGRRGHQQKAERPEPARHQPRIDQFAAADRHVHALGDHVDQPVVEVEVELDLRIAGLEVRQHRQQEAVADGRQAHAQPAARLGDGVLHHRARIVELVEDAAAALVEHRAFLREPHLARGAVEQPQAQLLLEPRHVLADRRGGDAEQPPRLGEAQQVGRPHEGFEAAETVHRLATSGWE